MLYVNPQVSSISPASAMKPGSARRESEVLKEYEQVFIFQMIKEMRKTVPDTGLLDSSQREYFDEMMDDFLAGEMAKSGQFGIAEQMASQIALQKGKERLPSDTGAGISLRTEREGIAVGKNTPSGLPLPTVQRGISRYKEVVDGIPLVQKTSK